PTTCRRCRRATRTRGASSPPTTSTAASSWATTCTASRSDAGRDRDPVCPGGAGRSSLGWRPSLGRRFLLERAGGGHALGQLVVEDDRPLRRGDRGLEQRQVGGHGAVAEHL